MTKSALLTITALSLIASFGCGRSDEVQDVRSQGLVAGYSLASTESPEPQEAPGGVVLTGDRARDKAALVAALKRNGAQLAEAQAAYDAAMKDAHERPTDALVRHLEEKVASLKGSLGVLQQQLDQVKSGKTPAPATERPAASEVKGLPELTGDRAQDKSALLGALKKSSQDLAAVEQEYARLLKEQRTPDPKTVERLEARQKECRARVEAIQGLLDRVKQS